MGVFQMRCAGQRESGIPAETTRSAPAPCSHANRHTHYSTSIHIYILCTRVIYCALDNNNNNNSNNNNNNNSAQCLYAYTIMYL